MKTEHKYTRIIALTIILLYAVNSIVISQGTDSRREYVKEKKLYIGFILTPQKTGISNNDFLSATPLNIKNGTSMKLALEGGYFFSKIAGISIGAEMGSYSSELSIDSCYIEFDATDKDEEDYKMQITGNSIIEEQKISFLSIPVCFILRIPAGEKLGFYLKAGLSFAIPIVKTYEGSGKFTYDGYYAAYPVLLHNIPAYFPSNVNTPSSGNLEVKSFSQTLVASGGLSFKVSESIHLTLGLHFNRSLGNISAYDPGSEYKLTSEPNEMNSIMGGASGAGVQGLGISLGVKYYIR